MQHADPSLSPQPSAPGCSSAPSHAAHLRTDSICGAPLAGTGADGVSRMLRCIFISGEFTVGVSGEPGRQNSSTASWGGQRCGLRLRGDSGRVSRGCSGVYCGLNFCIPKVSNEGPQFGSFCPWGCGRVLSLCGGCHLRVWDALGDECAGRAERRADPTPGLGAESLMARSVHWELQCEQSQHSCTAQRRGGRGARLHTALCHQHCWETPTPLCARGQRASSRSEPRICLGCGALLCALLLPGPVPGSERDVAPPSQFAECAVWGIKTQIRSK